MRGPGQGTTARQTVGVLCRVMLRIPYRWNLLRAAFRRETVRRMDNRSWFGFSTRRSGAGDLRTLAQRLVETVGLGGLGLSEPFRASPLDFQGCATMRVHPIRANRSVTRRHPFMKNDTQTIIINFGDDATTWFREISAAVQAGPRAINVQFVGGACPPAFETVSLRNMLLQIPGHIKLTTTAACSLPPLTCAAWLVGDERRIARDAVVWIPESPANLMDNVSDSSSQGQTEVHESEPVDDDAEEPTPFDEPSRRPRNTLSRRGYTMGEARLKADLRTLAHAVNEWFPSWEFIGSSLSVGDLLEWDVIRPEWVFGGRAPRTRALPPPAAKATMRTTKKAQAKALETEPTQADAGQIPNTEAGERSPGSRGKQ